MPLSIGAMLIKQLFFAKGISTQSFLHDSGISFETLKRHVTKINRGIKPYNIRIQLNAKQVKLSGSEISIRVFFHRLLLPLPTIIISLKIMLFMNHIILSFYSH